MTTAPLQAAIHDIQLAHAEIPGDLQGLLSAMSGLDEVLGLLSDYSRRLSVVVEGLPDRAVDLRVHELEGEVPADLVCNQIAIHVQATAAGIDQARTAVCVAHQLGTRLHLLPAELA